MKDGVAMCGFHHRLLHERRCVIERTPLDENGKRPMRSVSVTTPQGEVIELASPMTRFRVRRPDGSYVC
ncbi:MAG: hypothetical protein ACR2PS_12890 [Pseudomonadales bacterium]